MSALNYLLLLSGISQPTLTEEVDYTCKSNHMHSMKNCPYYSALTRRNYARQGFYFDGENIVSVFCGYELGLHKVRICSMNVGNRKQKAFNFSVLIPLYK